MKFTCMRGGLSLMHVRWVLSHACEVGYLSCIQGCLPTNVHSRSSLKERTEFVTAIFLLLCLMHLLLKWCSLLHTVLDKTIEKIIYCINIKFVQKTLLFKKIFALNNCLFKEKYVNNLVVESYRQFIFN